MENLLIANKINKYILEKKSYENRNIFKKIKLYFKKNYIKKYILKNCTLQLNKGESIAILGRNGAGKSTLIKILTGITIPSSGDLIVCQSKPHLRESHFLKNIGVVFGHKNSLVWDLPLIDSLILHKIIYNIDEAQYYKKLNYLLDILNLSECMESKVKFMSLGQRVKSNILMNLLHSPALVFLDEPTIGVDIESKNQIREFINYEKQHNKTSFIMTSHDSTDIENCSDYIHVLSNGEIAFSEKTFETKNTYKNKTQIIVKKLNINKEIFNPILKNNDIIFKETINSYKLTIPKENERETLNFLLANNIVSFEIKAMTFEDIIADMFNIAANFNNEEEFEYE
ncbi:ATP-binding cassette domain-containing protein [Silvanigrella aquatica]|uniref:ABC transporter domain-containing protein n=1 Tax=Silvanigrella aquatica TaxID=1915309 RepID=A0A1L4CXE8_9BACT|nr:ATP-binding cassette domain-containing protein [Silvanigrella aquatica]APJ02620.1 hypothetical protein AXG55_01190 [Silvanigrella aquatica]